MAFRQSELYSFMHNNSLTINNNNLFINTKRNLTDASQVSLWSMTQLLNQWKILSKNVIVEPSDKREHSGQRVRGLSHMKTYSLFYE